MALRDFDPTQLETDFTAIQEQAGVTFSIGGSTVTGVWAASRDMFTDWEDQRRFEIKYTIFFLTSQMGSAPQISQTLIRNGVTYFVEQLSFDAEGSGCQMDVCKAI